MNLSKRYSVPLLALLLLAATPIGMRWWSPRAVETCRAPDAFLDPLAIDEGSVPNEDSPWESERAIGRVSGRIRPQSARQAPLSFLITRARGLPQALQNPSLMVPGRLEPDRLELEWLEPEDGGEPLPVHIASQAVERGTLFAVYGFFYDERAVESPFRARLASTWAELAGGSRPMTLVAVSGTAARLYTAETQRRAREWITKAWSHYQATCLGEGAPALAGD